MKSTVGQIQRIGNREERGQGHPQGEKECRRDRKNQSWIQWVELQGFWLLLWKCSGELSTLIYVHLHICVNIGHTDY